MSKKFNIKPPIWPKELNFEEFKNLNSHINESQIVSLYNQYLHKYLTELAERKIHFKQSIHKQLQLEVKKFQNLSMFDNYNLTASPGSVPATAAGAASFTYNCPDGRPGIGCYTVGVYLSEDRTQRSLDTPIDEGFPRFTVGSIIEGEPPLYP